MTVEPDDRDDPDDEFLTASCQAMRRSGGPPALDALGWWAFLPHLDDPEARAAVFAVFRAQGRELACSPALGGLLAQPFLDGTAIAPGSVVAATRRRSSRRGPIWVVVGEPGGRRLLFADPDAGVFLADEAAVELRLVDVPGRLTVHEVSVDPSAHEPIVTGDEERARRRSIHLGRVAAAAEILGAAERAVAVAVEHAGNREQFGRPIGTFQAVRHLLAWAETDCVAIDAVLRTALLTLDDPLARYDQVVKAIAGRNGRRACERSLQVLGAIGFTAEHAHHHHHSRVLLLDALLGSSAELSHDLGAWLRTSGEDPRYPATLLTGRR